MIMTTLKVLLLFVGLVLIGFVGGFIVAVKVTARCYAEIMAEALVRGRYEANGRVFKIEEVENDDE